MIKKRGELLEKYASNKKVLEKMEQEPGNKLTFFCTNFQSG